jgi:hypothetical protein
MMRALMLECGRTKTCIPQLLALLNDAALRRHLAGAGGAADTVMQTVHGIFNAPVIEGGADSSESNEGEGYHPEGRCGRAFGYLLLETCAFDAAACCAGVLHCVNEMSRAVARVDAAHATGIRDACVDLLVWLVRKFPAPAAAEKGAEKGASTAAASASISAAARETIAVYANALRDPTSLFYQTCGVPGADSCLADASGADVERASALRARLLRCDRPQLAKRVMVEIECVPNADKELARLLAAAEAAADQCVL